MRRYWYIFLLLCCVASGNAFCQDAVEKELDAAISKYDRDVLSTRTDLIETLEQRATLYQKDGDLDGYERVQSELQAFQQKQTLPESVSTRIYSRKISKAKIALERAYELAIKKYTRSNDIPSAKAIQKELDGFRTGGRKVNDQLFHAGETFSGSRSTWDRKTKPFGFAITKIDGSRFAGYIVRKTDSGPVQLPALGEIDGPKIRFDVSGVAGKPLARLRMKYEGERETDTIKMKYSGTGPFGDRASGEAIVTLESATKDGRTKR